MSIAKINRALKQVMPAGEVNAARVWKGNGTDGYGWYVEQFGRNAEFIGRTVNEAVETIGRWADD